MEYINLRFYREFGWTPDQLRSAPSEEILKILTMWEVESRVKSQRERVGKK